MTAHWQLLTYDVLESDRKQIALLNGQLSFRRGHLLHRLNHFYRTRKQEQLESWGTIKIHKKSIAKKGVTPTIIALGLFG